MIRAETTTDLQRAAAVIVQLWKDLGLLEEDDGYSLKNFVRRKEL